jgi:hypothetical protein
VLGNFERVESVVAKCDTFQTTFRRFVTLCFLSVWVEFGCWSCLALGLFLGVERVLRARIKKKGKFPMDLNRFVGFVLC